MIDFRAVKFYVRIKNKADAQSILSICPLEGAAKDKFSVKLSDASFPCYVRAGYTRSGRHPMWVHDDTRSLKNEGFTKLNLRTAVSFLRSCASARQTSNPETPEVEPEASQHSNYELFVGSSLLPVVKISSESFRLENRPISKQVWQHVGIRTGWLSTSNHFSVGSWGVSIERPEAKFIHTGPYGKYTKEDFIAVGVMMNWCNKDGALNVLRTSNATF